MEKKRATFKIAVHLILKRDNKILLLRRYNTGFQDGNYSVVAGHLDGNEKATNAIAREALEEAGIIIEPSLLEMIHVMHRKSGKADRLDLFFTVHTWKGNPVVLEKDKADDIGWFNIDHLPANMVPYVKKAINDIEREIIYSEFGWDD